MEVTNEELEKLKAQFRKRMNDSGLYPRHYFSDRFEAVREKAREHGFIDPETTND